MIKLSIITVAFKDFEAVNRLMRTLPDNKAIEILVVNNTIYNRGFGVACNEAVKFAKGEYILFLNPDTELYSGDLLSFVELMQKDNSIGVMGPQLVDAQGKPYLSYSLQPTRISAPIVYSLLNRLFSKSSLVRHHWFNQEVSTQPIDVGIVSGAALLIKREQFEYIGGFDPHFFLYWEEVDLCRRILNLGLKVIYDPRLKVHHEGATSTIEVKTSAKNWFKESRFHFFRKHFGWLYGLMIETWLTLTEEWRLVLSFLILLSLSSGYFVSGLWLGWSNQTIKDYWLGIAALIAFLGIVITSLRGKRLLVISFGLLMLWAAPLLGIFGLGMMAAWSMADLIKPWQGLRDKIVYLWMIMSLVLIGIHLPKSQFVMPHVFGWQWIPVLQTAQIPFKDKQSVACLGCNQMDMQILQTLVSVGSLEQSRIIVALPPYNEKPFLDAVRTKVGEVMIVWPFNR